MTEILTNGFREQAERAIARMTEEVSRLNHAKGWYDNDRSVGDLCALLHSEVSEVLDAYRKTGFETRYETVRPQEQYPGQKVDLDAPPKPEGVGSEMADIFIRLLDMAKRWEIDIIAEYERKMKFNWTRPYHHGDKHAL